ncbi:MAG TPA: DUF6159 family protein [Solirubrobacteraceae bacterium]|jgi:hypothetical protein
MALPALSALFTTLAAVAIAIAVLLPQQDGVDVVSLVVLAAVLGVVLTCVGTYFNVGFLSMVLASRRSDEPTVRDGLRAATHRLPQIVVWSVLSTVVGGALQGLSQLPGGDFIGRALGWLGGVAWSLATFFVVPILAIEGTGALASIRRSASTFRSRWGESVTGDVTIGFIFGLLTIPGAILVAIGVASLDGGSSVVCGALIAAGVAGVVVPMVAASALTQLFTMELYLFDQDRPASAPFATEDLKAAMKQRKRGWLRR